MMNAEIVTHHADGTTDRTEVPASDAHVLAQQLEVLGYHVTGFVTRASLRVELQGAPKIDRVAGPMFSGTPGVVRYEDTRAAVRR